MRDWYKSYENLDLLNGKIEFILEDDQDMIEIRYSDGMLIDVGYIDDLSKYYITVVLSDDEKSWQNPIDVIEVISKDALFKKLQEAIFKYRKVNFQRCNYGDTKSNRKGMRFSESLLPFFD